MTENVKSEMKPCPFCGDPATNLDDVTMPEHKIEGDPIIACLSPDCPQVSTRLMFWNTRPGEDAARKQQFEADCKVIDSIIELEVDIIDNTANLLNNVGRKQALEALWHAWEARENG